MGDSMMEPDAMRKYGHSYNGFGGIFSWCELLVKRMYVLCVYLVDHVLIFQKVQYNIVLFTCIGAVFWSLHGTYEPYDTRVCRGPGPCEGTATSSTALWKDSYGGSSS